MVGFIPTTHDDWRRSCSRKAGHDGLESGDQMKSFALVTALFTFSVTAAQADDKLNCNSQNLNQFQLDQCAGQDFTKSDVKLNTLYRDLLKRYDADNATKLKTAERAWLAYRDAECDYETNSTAGGTINPMMDTMCRTEKTNARIKDLDTQLRCPEGDLSCNLPVK
jgi:uncharacterized protein YecT (DUF1311 family)